MRDLPAKLYAVAEAARRVIAVAEAVLDVGEDPADNYDRLFEVFLGEVQLLEGRLNPEGLPTNHPARKDVARLLTAPASERLVQALGRVLDLHDEVAAAWHFDNKVRIVERSDRFVEVRRPLRVLTVRPERLDEMLAAAEGLERLLGDVGEQPGALAQADASADQAAPEQDDWSTLRPTAREIARFLRRRANQSRAFRGHEIADEVARSRDYVRGLLPRLSKVGYVRKVKEGYRAGPRKPPRGDRV